MVDLLLIVSGAVVWFIGRRGENRSLRILGGALVALGIVVFAIAFIHGCSLGVRLAS